jgi:predicted MPP superfamily phosphohydrolase
LALLLSKHFVDFLVLPVLGLVQCIIAWAVLRYSSRRHAMWLTGLIALGLAAGGAIMLVGALSEFGRFAIPFARILGWKNVDRAKIVTFLWCFSSTPALALYCLSRLAAKRVSPVHQPQRRKLLLTAGKVVAGAPFVVIGYGATAGRTSFEVKEVEIPVPNLPPDLSRIRIVQLSDLHLGPFLSERELARVIDAANELRPDIGLVTGDLISSIADPIDLALKQCARLRAQRILGCLGNHERYAVLEDYVAEHGAMQGISFLRQRAESLRFGSAELNLGGVDYQPFSNRHHYLEGADSLIRPGAVNVLLSHNPDVFPTAARQGWDVTLAGHTHGGQVTVEILNQTLNFARAYTPYVSGLYRGGRSSCYVTRGIGTIWIPVRVGAPPEITLIRLVKERSV